MGCISQGFIAGDRVLSSFNTHPDWLAVFGHLGGFAFVGGSVVGRLHRKMQRGREDSLLVRSKGDWLAVALADGVGSAPKSVWGATFAVSVFADYVLTKLPLVVSRRRRFRLRTSASCAGESDEPYSGWNEIGVLSWFEEKGEEGEEPPSWDVILEYLYEAGTYTHTFLRNLAQREARPESDFATTLLFCLCNVSQKRGLFFHLGDGAILGVQRGGKSLLLSVQEDCDLGETAVLTQPDWQRYCRVGSFDFRRERLEALLLMTDGLADDCLYGPPEDVTDRFVRDLLREVSSSGSLERAARRLVTWLGTYTLPGSFDDRTLVVVYRCG
ncbi:MAG: protein phosphatase 2C domain-containing protein [Atribacterota bacterium]